MIYFSVYSVSTHCLELLKAYKLFCKHRTVLDITVNILPWFSLCQWRVRGDHVSEAMTPSTQTNPIWWQTWSPHVRMTETHFLGVSLMLTHQRAYTHIGWLVWSKYSVIYPWDICWLLTSCVLDSGKGTGSIPLNNPMIRFVLWNYNWWSAPWKNWSIVMTEEELEGGEWGQV